VSALHQDRRGFLWVGTYGGLSRYDGRTFHTLTARDGLSANRVTDIVETADGTLVAATTGGGVCFVANGVIVDCLRQANGLAGDEVNDLFADGDGSVWVATTNGLTELRNRRPVRTFRMADGLPSDDVRKVGLLDVMWVLTSSGAAELHGDDFEPARFFSVDGSVAVVLPTDHGTLFGGSTGLVRYHEGTTEHIALPDMGAPPMFTDAALDHLGRAWFTTSEGVLVYENGKVVHLTEANGLASNRTDRVLVDSDGVVWFATEGGLSKLVPGPFALLGEESGLPDKTARTLALDNEGRVWVGTRNGAAVQEGERFNALPLPAGITDPRVYSLGAAPEGGMLVGTRSGLVYYHEGGTRVYRVHDGLPADYVSSLLPDATGVWVGTEHGLARWERGVILPVDVPELKDVYFTNMTFDSAGRIWAGLRSGVRVWDGRTVRVLGQQQGLTDQWVWDVAADRAGRIWIGTNGDGVFVAEGDSIRQITTRDGLANDFVWSVLPDSRGDVWFFSSFGLDRSSDGSIRHYGAGDGVVDLEGSATAALEDTHGLLWIGAATGLYRYDRSLDAPDTAPPPVYADGPTVGARRFPRIDAELPSRPGVVTMHFSSPTFRDERAVRFRYRLAGDGGGWSEPVAEGTVSLAGLGPGSYTFEVVAVNPNGVISAEPARVRFTVLPTFWQTTWFLGLSALLATAALAGVPFLRARSLERERRRLEGLVREHTRELALREERIRAILEHSTNLFYAHTPDHQLTYVSPQSWQFLDCSPEDALKDWTEFLEDDPENDAGRAATERAIRTGVRQPPYELELRTAKGRRLRVLVNEAPVVVDGRTVSIVGSLTDITERREAEEQRRRLEEQFLQAQRMEAVGRLAGGVAHDFNNLLTSIMGHAQLISEASPTDGEMLEDLAEIEKAARRGSSLVSQLLGFSRLQIRRDERMDVRDSLADLRELLVRLTTGRIELDMRPGDAALHVHFDRAQLSQVVANLVLNAVDAMPHGGRLSVAVRSVDLLEPVVREGPDEIPAGRYVGIEVADTGSGMERGVLEHVFEPFFTTKEPGTASGLGLSMVYGAVRQGGGYVTASSTPAVGTVVRILLPPAA
jgi:PAS domain S-box-containing protein